MEQLVDAVLKGLIFLISAVIVFWMAGALFFDVARASVIGGVSSIVWILTAVLSFLFWQPPQKPFAVLLVLFIFWLASLSGPGRIPDSTPAGQVA